MAQPAFTTEITIDGQKVVLSVPRGTRAWRKSNAVFCPLGPAPSRAWFLMKREDLLEVVGSGSGQATSAKTITWKTIGSGGGPTETLTFSPFYLVAAERVLPGGEDDDNSLYLVEFADARWVCERTSMTGPVRANLRSYANAADYLTGASGSTWSSLVEELWDDCGVLGAFPGLPGGLPIDGVPENTFLIALNAWRSLCAVLDQLDCAVAHDPIQGTYEIRQLGGTLQTIPDHNDSLKYNGQPISVNHAAANVAVHFFYHRKGYGQERDTELATNWIVQGASEIIEVATGIAGAQGTKCLWDDLPWILDEDEAHTNLAANNTRAANRAARYASRMSVDDEHRIHYGLIDDLLPGGKIRATLWRNWDDPENPLGGTVTEFVCKSDLVTGLDAGGFGAAAWFDRELYPPEREQYAPPDYGRKTTPTYPRLPNIVQVNSSGASAGETVEANADGFHRGRVKRWVANAMATLDDCWIRFVDDHDNLDGDVDAVQGEFYGPARLSGVSTSDGSLLPVYLVRKGQEANFVVQFKLIDDLAIGEDAIAIIRTWNGAEYEDGAEIRVFDWYSLTPQEPGTSRGMWTGIEGMEGVAIKRATQPPSASGLPEYDVVWMEMWARFVGNTLSQDMDPVDDEAESSVDYAFGQGIGPDAPVTLHDDQELFPYALEGAKCWAVRNEYLNAESPLTPYYQIWQSNQMCFLATAILDQSMCGAEDASASISSFARATFAPFGQVPDPLPTTASNRYHLYGKNASPVLLMWDEETEEWVIIQVRWYKYRVAVEDESEVGPIRVQGNFIQAYLLETGVMACGDPTWVDKIDLTPDCPPGS